MTMKTEIVRPIKAAAKNIQLIAIAEAFSCLV